MPRLQVQPPTGEPWQPGGQQTYSLLGRQAPATASHVVCSFLNGMLDMEARIREAKQATGELGSARVRVTRPRTWKS